MKGAFIIRDLRHGDRKDLIENYFSYYDELSSDPYFGIIFYKKRPSYKSELKWFSSMEAALRKGETVVSVAEADGRVVGLCDASTHRPNSEIDHVGHVGIAIRAGYRDIGIGDALMRDVIRKSRGRFEVLALAVLSKNARAKHLYRKLGFRRYGAASNTIKRGNRYLDEEFMFMNLKRFPR